MRSTAPTLLFACLLPLSLACVKADTHKDAAQPADAADDVASPPGDAPADATPDTQRDTPAPPADAPPLADAAADRFADTAPADSAPNLPPSPCPGGPAPPGYNLTCGCLGDGQIQCDGTCNKPDGTCVPTGQFYVLTNMFLGETRRLDTYNSATADAFMARTLGASGQFWNITASGSAYRLTNMFLGAARSLEAAADGSKLFMGTTGDSAAQKWRIRAVGAGLFRIQNVALTDAKSLDTHNDTTNDPWLPATGNYTGQVWKLTKSP